MANEIGKMLMGEKSAGGGSGTNISTSKAFAMLGPPTNVKNERVG